MVKWGYSFGWINRNPPTFLKQTGWIWWGQQNETLKWKKYIINHTDEYTTLWGVLLTNVEVNVHLTAEKLQAWAVTEMTTEKVNLFHHPCFIWVCITYQDTHVTSGSPPVLTSHTACRVISRTERNILGLWQSLSRGRTLVRWHKSQCAVINSMAVVFS